MAKENNKNNSKDVMEDEGGAADTVAAKSKRKKQVLIVAVALILIAVSVGSTLALVKLFADPEVPAVAAEVEADAITEEAALPAKSPAIYFPLQPAFVVNFEFQGRQRYLQAEINLLLRDNDVIPALELHMPAIRNSLVMLFGGQIYEDLQTAEGKELLRQQALLSVQEVLEKEIGKPGVEQVLFTNFVMQ